MQALADPIRRDILCRLREMPLTAGAIADAFPVSRPAVSRHLRVLREAGLVCVEESGRERVYSLQLEPLAQIETYLADLRDSRQAIQATWERRFMKLETEVYRVRARRKTATAKPAHHTSALNTKRRTG